MKTIFISILLTLGFINLNAETMNLKASVGAAPIANWISFTDSAENVAEAGSTDAVIGLGVIGTVDDVIKSIFINSKTNAKTNFTMKIGSTDAAKNALYLNGDTGITDDKKKILLTFQVKFTGGAFADNVGTVFNLDKGGTSANSVEFKITASKNITDQEVGNYYASLPVVIVAD